MDKSINKRKGDCITVYTVSYGQIEIWDVVDKAGIETMDQVAIEKIAGIRVVVSNNCLEMSKKKGGVASGHIVFGRLHVLINYKQREWMQVVQMFIRIVTRVYSLQILEM